MVHFGSFPQPYQWNGSQRASRRNCAQAEVVWGGEAAGLSRKLVRITNIYGIHYKLVGRLQIARNF